MPPSQSDRFEKLRQLGTGSIGPIFEARDHDLDRPVAIRELSQRLVEDPALTGRVLARVEKMATISHPHVMTIHAVEPRHQPPRFIVELLAGNTVADLLTQGPVSPERVALLLGQALEGLQQLHHHDLAHGDLRPSHLFVHRNTLKIGDFGLTALDDHGKKSPETVRYSPPELLAKDTRPLPTSDLFALGLIAYELTLGTERFLRVVVDHLEAIDVREPSLDGDQLWRRLHTSPTELPALRAIDPSIPAQFSDTVGHMLRKDPADRPEDCRRALRELATMRGWTEMFEAVRRPFDPTEVADDPVDDLLRRLSPRRAAIALTVIIVLASAAFLLRRDSGLTPDPEAAPGPEPRPPKLSVVERPAELLSRFERPAELLSRFEQLVSPQPTGSISLPGGRGTFEIGDPLIFEVTSSHSVYAALFVVSLDGTVLCLYPNRKRSYLRLEADRTAILPGLDDNLIGIALKADLPLGEDVAFLLTSRDVLPRPPVGAMSVGEWILTFPFVHGPDNPAAGFLDWVERRSEEAGVEIDHLRYRIVAGN